MFAVDRSSLNTPYKLWQKGSDKFYYQLSPRDEERVQEVIKEYGENYTMTENEVPWSRGKRSTGSENVKGQISERASSEDVFKPYCVLLQPDERTTGAVGDVDGDGRLDVIVNVVSVGIIRDKHAFFVKMKFDTDLFKFSLDDLLARHVTTPVNVTMDHRLRFDSIGLKPMTSLKFLPKKQQLWGGYMGTTGDSHYVEQFNF